MKQTKFLFVLALLCLQSMQIAYAYDFEADGIAYTIVSVQERKVCVDGLTSSCSENVVIPDKVMFNDFWFSVDSIARLYNSQGTSSIKFNSLINTGGRQLYGCNTAYFYVDDSNPHITAVDGVLYSKDMTRLISFPMNKYCEEFIIPESVVSIDEYSFGANKYITRLIFNDNIEELPEKFLYGYSGRLKYLKLSDKIKVIHGRCLYDVPLEEIILPKSLEEVEIDPYFIYYGLPTSLLNVTIFNSKIANYVYTLNPSLHIFSRFEKLKNLYVNDSNPVAIDDNVFTEGQYFTINLYVPEGAKEKYKNLDGWKNFYNIKEQGQQTSFLLTISGNNGGKIEYGNQIISNGSSRISVSKNQSVTLTITPDEGYEIRSVTLNGTDVTDDLYNNTYTIAQIKENIDFRVEFARTATYLSLKQPTGSMDIVVKEGERQTVRIVPESGYTIHSVTYNGADITNQLSADNVFVTPAITENAVLYVTYENGDNPPVNQAKYLSIKHSENGTVKQKITLGRSYTYKISPVDGQKLSALYFNGVDVTSEIKGDKFTTPVLNDNATLEVEFKAK